MSKYTIIERLDNYQYIEGCPVFITGGNLLKNTEDNKIVINIRLKNNIDKIIKAVIVIVKCFDIEGDELEGIPKYQLLDLNIAKGQTFGDDCLIECPNEYTRKCSIIIKSVIFGDDEKWVYSDNCQRHIFGLRDRIDSHEKKNYIKMLLKELGCSNENMKYLPANIGKFWLCPCGCLNSNGEDHCCCGLSREEAFSVLDETKISECEEKVKAEEERIRQAEIERKKQRRLQEMEEEEERKRQQAEMERRISERMRMEEEQKKKRIIVGVIIGVIVILFIVFCNK